MPGDCRLAHCVRSLPAERRSVVSDGDGFFECGAPARRPGVCAPSNSFARRLSAVLPRWVDGRCPLCARQWGYLAMSASVLCVQSVCWVPSAYACVCGQQLMSVHALRHSGRAACLQACHVALLDSRVSAGCGLLGATMGFGARAPLLCHVLLLCCPVCCLVAFLLMLSLGAARRLPSQCCPVLCVQCVSPIANLTPEPAPVVHDTAGCLHYTCVCAVPTVLCAQLMQKGPADMLPGPAGFWCLYSPSSIRLEVRVRRHGRVRGVCVDIHLCRPPPDCTPFECCFSCHSGSDVHPCTLGCLGKSAVSCRHGWLCGTCCESVSMRAALGARLHPLQVCRPRQELWFARS